MSTRIELVSFVLRTSIGRPLKAIALRRGGKLLFLRLQRMARQRVVNRLAAAVSEAWMVGAMVDRAMNLYPAYAQEFPFLARVPAQRFAEAVAEVMVSSGPRAGPTPAAKRFVGHARDRLSVIMGRVVERFIPDMPQMQALMQQARAAVRAAGKGWGEPVLVSGCRTLDKQRELGDWLIISRHADGRVWVISFIESKSHDTIDGLIPGGGKAQAAAGQHLWDIARARSEGFTYSVTQGSMVVEYRVPADKVLSEPMPPPSWRKPGSMYTRLVAVAPRPLKAGELKRLGAAGLDVEHWDWPVDPRQLLRMVQRIHADLIPLIDLPP
ncbi:MAG: hypothetical protein ING41_13455 [Burkholderiales bacterium]|nr:hypothetical protein [Burkholderiales bacterium]